jgi:RHS repeat-associated protein
LAYDAANELTSLNRGSGATAFSYDPQGNRTGAIPSTGPHVSYAYDQVNRLVSFTRRATNGQGVTAASYTYNGDGLRMRKVVNGVTSAFVWDTAQKLPLLLRDGTTSYVTCSSGLPLEQVSSSGTVLYYHADQLGSTRMLTDASGKIAASYTYDAYGNPSANAGTIVNPFGFAGEYTDAESGFVYLRARYYDPATGQFLSVDPLATLTREPYPYVHDDPLNLTDPSGQFDERKPVGKIAYTDSDPPGGTALVLVQRKGSNAWFFAHRGMPVYIGDKIQNLPGSLSGIEYENGTQIGINYETTVLIDTESSAADFTVRSRWKKFKLSLGGLWCRITHQAEQESFTVETRGGVLGIRDAGYRELPGPGAF